MSRSDFKPRPGDHLHVHGKPNSEGPVECTVYHTDGTGEDVIVLPGSGRNASRVNITPCHDSRAGEQLFHLSEGRTGPAMVNSQEFCENYERIFRKKEMRN